jgi:hypothetical protein
VFIKREKMNSKIANAVASVGVLVAASMLPLVAAGPASAVTRQCVGYLQGKSYAPTGARIHACYQAGHFNGSIDKTIKFQACWAELVSTGVRTSHANAACDWAQTNE